jgi:hypothetical protein
MKDRCKTVVCVMEWGIGCNRARDMDPIPKMWIVGDKTGIYRRFNFKLMIEVVEWLSLEYWRNPVPVTGTMNKI